MTGRLVGGVLFLPVPLVLWLFTRPPLGVIPSIVLGVAVMATHRWYARPFALRRAGGRCLWCGKEIAEGPGLRIDEPFGTTTWRACGDAHAGAVARVLGWADGRATFLRVGILGTLGFFLVGVTVADVGWLSPIGTDDAIAFFRLGIAVTVLPLGWLSTRASAPPAGPCRSPFPLHVPSLIGLWAVLWLFRLIGLVWFVLAMSHAVRRLT